MPSYLITYLPTYLLTQERAALEKPISRDEFEFAQRIMGDALLTYLPTYLHLRTNLPTYLAHHG